MTKFNVDKQFLDIEDKPIDEFTSSFSDRGTQIIKKTGKQVTYRSIIIDSVLNPKVKQGEVFEQTLDDFEIAMKVRKGGEVDLSSKEIERIIVCVDQSKDIYTRGMMKRFLDITEKEKK